jgi:hypothetical protein
MTTFGLAQWWEPHAPAGRIAGTLFHDDTGSVRLSLDGHFPVPLQNGECAADGIPRPVSPPMSDIPMLVGVTSEGKYITLIDCRVVKASGIPGFTKTSQEIKPELVAYDVHCGCPEEFRLTSLWVRYSNLDEWASTSGFKAAITETQPYRVSMEYVKPEPIRAVLSNGLRVGVGFSATGPDYARLYREMRMEQAAWLTIDSTEERPYDELIRVLTLFADLVALGIGQPLRPLELQAGALDLDSGKSVHFDLYHNAKPIAPVLPDIDAPWMLFTLTDLQTSFTKTLETWCIQQERIQPLYGLYFGTLRSQSMYVEHRFLNMFQALEAFDRRDHVMPPEKLEKHNLRLDRIFQAAGNTHDRKWLKRHLRYSHEPAAVDRLRRLIAKYDAAWVFDDLRREPELAANLRNFYTHYDRKLEPSLPPEHERPRIMHNLATRLQLLCEVILLTEIGFTGDQIKQRMNETHRLERRLAK